MIGIVIAIALAIVIAIIIERVIAIVVAVAARSSFKRKYNVSTCIDFVLLFLYGG